MATIYMPTIVDDDGTGQTGTILDKAWMTAFKEAIESALDAASVVPAGGIAAYGGVTAPNGWLLCDGSYFQRSEYPQLFAAIGQAFNVPFTADNTTNTLTCTGHSFNDDDTVTLWSEDALPNGLDAAATYYVINRTENTLQFSLAQGGAVVTFSDNGSGRMTISLSSSFRIPDLRGRSPLGAGEGDGLTARTLGEIGGEEEHVLTVSEMPSHTHSSTWYFGREYDGHRNKTISGVAEYARTVSVGNTGGSQSHNTMHPFVIVNFIIKY